MSSVGERWATSAGSLRLLAPCFILINVHSFNKMHEAPTMCPTPGISDSPSLAPQFFFICQLWRFPYLFFFYHFYLQNQQMLIAASETRCVKGKISHLLPQHSPFSSPWWNQGYCSCILRKFLQTPLLDTLRILYQIVMEIQKLKINLVGNVPYFPKTLSRAVQSSGHLCKHSCPGLQWWAPKHPCSTGEMSVHMTSVLHYLHIFVTYSRYWKSQCGEKQVSEGSYKLYVFFPFSSFQHVFQAGHPIENGL